jgi:hypothetical protein
MDRSTVSHNLEVQGPEGSAHLDADGLDAWEFNRRLRELAASEPAIVVHNPRARHNLGVGLDRPVHIVFAGSVGYYCGGFNNGAFIEIFGNADGGSRRYSGRFGPWQHRVAAGRRCSVADRGRGGAARGVAMKGGTCWSRVRQVHVGFMAHRASWSLGRTGDAALPPCTRRIRGRPGDELGRRRRRGGADAKELDEVRLT